MNSLIAREYMDLDNEQENLKKYYIKSVGVAKIPVLTEYYKYHNPIPRLFMNPISLSINKMYDKKRKLEYWKIVRKIEEENKRNPSQPPKGIVGEKPLKRSSSDSSYQSNSEQPNLILPGKILDKIDERDLNEEIRSQQLKQVISKPKQVETPFTKKGAQPSSSYKKNLQLDDQALDIPSLTQAPELKRWIIPQTTKQETFAYLQPQQPRSARNSELEFPVTPESKQQQPKPSAQRFKQQLLNLDSLKSQQFNFMKHEIVLQVQQSPRGQPHAQQSPKAPITPRQQKPSQGTDNHQPYFQVLQMNSSPRHKGQPIQQQQKQNLKNILSDHDLIKRLQKLSDDKQFKPKSGSLTQRESSDIGGASRGLQELDENEKQFDEQKQQSFKSTKAPQVPKPSHLLHQSQQQQINNFNYQSRKPMPQTPTHEVPKQNSTTKKSQSTSRTQIQQIQFLQGMVIEQKKKYQSPKPPVIGEELLDRQKGQGQLSLRGAQKNSFVSQRKSLHQEQTKINQKSIQQFQSQISQLKKPLERKKF